MNIYIGRDDEKKFNSICELVQNGFIDKNIIEKVDMNNKTIYEANTGNVYIFDASIKSIATGVGTTIGMSNDGASWFSFFHGKKVDTGKAAWTTLIESVAQNYHSRYSFLEFEQKDRVYDPIRVERQKNLISKFMEIFFSDIAYVSVINKVNSKLAADNVFCASMKMEIDDGGRQTTPVLCKVYFRQRGEELIPLGASDASIIDTNVQNIITDYVDDMKESTEEELEENSKVIIRVVNAVDKLINTPQFVKSVIYNSERDYDEVNDLIENGPNIFVKLECKNAKIIGISHVVWKNEMYEVSFNNKKVLRFLFGLKDRMSLFCINCNNTLLIDNNRIVVKEETEEGIIDREIELDSEKEKFGLTPEDIELINNNSEFINHMFRVSCSSKEMGTNQGCSKLCCNSQVLELNGIKKCKDCPIPEIVYRNKYGQVFLTNDVQFARDELMLVPSKVDDKKNVHTCEMCGRQFVTMGNKYNTLCKFCNDYGNKDVESFQEDVQHQGKKLYSVYKGMLPISVRMKAAFKPKYCFEEVDVILFRIGNDKYIVDKLDLEENGYLRSPRKVNQEK